MFLFWFSVIYQKYTDMQVLWIAFCHFLLKLETCHCCRLFWNWEGIAKVFIQGVLHCVMLACQDPRCQCHCLSSNADLCPWCQWWSCCSQTSKLHMQTPCACVVAMLANYLKLSISCYIDNFSVMILCIYKYISNHDGIWSVMSNFHLSFIE